MSTAQFTTPLIVVIPGQLITASLWNNEYTNLFTNLNPQGIGAYSDTDSEMQTVTDPFPSGTSRPTALSGELERIRYILNLIIGQTYWYQHPATDLETINTFMGTFPSGTKMVFYQAAAPTGWTQDTTNNDAALRVVSGAGAGTGGVTPISTGFAHTHTVASHTHDLANHTHDLSNHTHSTPNHQHQLDSTVTTIANASTNTEVYSADTDGASIRNAASGTNIGGARSLKNQTANSGSGTSGTPSPNFSGLPSTNTSGSSSPATDSQLGIMKYIDVIVCSKD